MTKFLMEYATVYTLCVVSVGFVELGALGLLITSPLFAIMIMFCFIKED